MADSAVGAITRTTTVQQARAGDFRRAMGRFPTGVVVVAGRHDGKPHGMTVNAFASVSLDPPLLMFCAARDSGTWLRLRPSGRFAVSVLAADQAEVGTLFATRGADRFAATVPWSLNRSGQPVLDDGIAWFNCVIADVLPAGDHDIVLGEVLDVDIRAEGDPLVFHRGGYARLSGRISAENAAGKS